MINRISGGCWKALPTFLFASLLPSQALASSGGILEGDGSGLDRNNIGCSTSGCHDGPRSTTQIGFLTFASQANQTASINDTTLKLGNTYTLRMHNTDVAPAGFSLGTVNSNGEFTAGDNNRTSFDATDVNVEVTHSNSGSDTWEFMWAPSSAGTGEFEWCTQQVDDNGSNLQGPGDAGDGPFDCGTQSFTVQIPSPPSVTGNTTQIFLETSDPTSRQINVSVADTNEGDLAGITYQWAPTTNLSNANAQNPLYSGSSEQTYTITATDETPQTGSFSVLVDIDPIPVAVISGAPVVPVQEGTNVSISGNTSTDRPTSNGAVGSVAGYQWTLRDPSNAVADSQTGTSPEFSFTAPDIPFSQSQTYTVELTVTDSQGQTDDADPVNIVFEDAAVGDSAPTILAINVTGSNEGETITLDATVTEAIADAQAVWSQTSGAPVVTLQGSGLSRTFVVDISDASAAGPVLEFSLMVTDGVGQFDNATVSVPINNGPTAAAGQDAVFSEGATVVLDGSASFDPDTTISLSWTQLTGDTITLSDPTVAMPEFVATDIPPAGVTAEFRLTVTDTGSLTSTDQVSITINNVNTPPVASAGAVQTVTEGALTTLNGSGTIDDDPSTLTYEWSQTAGTTVTLDDASAETPTFIAPNIGFDDNPVLTFELLATDAENLSSTASVMVNVSNNNMAPIADAGPAQNVSEGTQVVLNGNGSSDPDLAEDDSLTFAWVQIAGDSLPALTGADTSAPTFTAPLVEPAGLSATFELTVTDRAGLVDTDQTVVNIVNDNQPPTADAGVDQAVMGGATVQLDGSGSQDPDGPLSAVSWTQIDGPPVALADPAAAQTSFIAPPAAATPTLLTWRLTVVGNEGLQDQDAVIVTVTSAAATPPVANAGSDQTAESGDRIVLNGTESTDAGTGALAFSWSQIGALSVTLENPSSATPTFTVPDVGANGTTFVFELVVTNEDGLTATDRVEVVASQAGDLAPPLVAILPGVRTVPVGGNATAFVSVINTGDTLLEDCSIATGTPFPGSFSYQTTDPTTNALTGTADTPASISAGAAQSFVIGIVPSAPFQQTELSFTVDCGNTPNARSVPGLSTLLLSATETPTADVVALAVTTSGDGVLRIDGTDSSAAFGVASFNLGATSILRLAVDAPTGLQLQFSMCETLASTAACIAPPVDTINTNAFMNGTASYSIFVSAPETVEFDPENSRITVRFMEGDAIRGATSVAVTTQ